MRAEYDFSKGKRGAVIPQKGKTRISIFIDDVVLDQFRARAEKAGTGYQTMMNEALRKYLSESDQPVCFRIGPSPAVQAGEFTSRQCPISPGSGNRVFGSRKTVKKTATR